MGPASRVIYILYILFALEYLLNGYKRLIQAVIQAACMQEKQVVIPGFCFAALCTLHFPVMHLSLLRLQQFGLQTGMGEVCIQGREVELKNFKWEKEW